MAKMLKYVLRVVFISIYSQHNDRDKLIQGPRSSKMEVRQGKNDCIVMQ